MNEFILSCLHKKIFALLLWNYSDKNSILHNNLPQISECFQIHFHSPCNVNIFLLISFHCTNSSFVNPDFTENCRVPSNHLSQFIFNEITVTLTSAHFHYLMKGLFDYFDLDRCWDLDGQLHPLKKTHPPAGVL